MVHVLQQIKKLEQVSLTVVVAHSTGNKENFAFRLFKKLDQTLLPGDFDYAKKISLAELQSSYSCINLHDVTQFDTDLILNFTEQNLLDERESLTRHEIITISIGEANAVGFWEWYFKKSVTPISLTSFKAGKSWTTSSCTKTETLSFSRNATAAYAKAIDVLVLAVRDRANKIEKELNKANVEGNIHKKPNVFASAIACLKLFSRLIKKTLDKLFFIEQWAILFSAGTTEFRSPDLSKLKLLLPPKDRIWADPFLVPQTDKHVVFIEEMSLSTRRGHLSCLILNSDGEIIDSKKILEQPYHLSYPFVFEQDGTWFMIPESAENKTIDLYECTDFPFHWKFRKTLVENVQAYDATLHVQDGSLWLFCTVQNQLGGSPNNDLHIFYTENLFGDWTAHKLNPVISDPFTARPAGRIFMKDGALYRPSQICVPRYGYGLSLNKIVTLTKDEYSEEQVSTVLPNIDHHQLAVHTMNFSLNSTVLDALIKRPRFFS